MTALEKFREACVVAEDAPIEIFDEKVDAMLAAKADLETEPDYVEQALTLAEDPNPMVRYTVAVIIRPTYRERAKALFKAVSEGRVGHARTWALAGESEWSK